ncbi:MAG: YicC family protein [Oscillospiraceae bacterium]|nr:YicC family protein [Oscillospiraceae bacterium]MBQ3241639.1 YicC family protein [Oscillospiraceae bacterium]MBQ7083457.1 YicC family protein [Oscillospiraceae bacterium]MBR2636684.1 YicC family protein [Oscillospiraceae bacterium]
MIRSMTGYGRAEALIGGRNILVEIRSVNHRYFEFSSRVPRAYGYLESRLKGFLQGKLSRGKVDVNVSIQTIEGTNANVQVNAELAKSYVDALRTLSEPLSLQDDLSLASICRFSDIFTVSRETEDEDAIWADVLSVAEEAADRFVQMREVEGTKMREDVEGRLDFILSAVEKIEERSPKTVEEYRTRLYNKISEVLQNAQVDETRILTEAAIYAEKIAVAEETVRLRSHVAQFRSIMEQEGAVGRKLDFLIQEFNRETNTIGSKAQDIEIARIVVDVKSEIEKIREQIQNIE